MHLFSRLASLQGSPGATLDWATRITGRVNEVGSVQTSLWTAAFGYPGGTVAWSTVVESRAQLADEFNKLGGDPQFNDLLDEGQQFAGSTPFQDTLRSIVHMTREPQAEGPPVGAVAELVTAVAGEGKFGAAVAWGTEIADLVTDVTDAGVVFMVDDYGMFGQVTWISIHADAAAADASASALEGHEAYLASIDKAGADGMFVPLSGHRGSLVRFA